MTKASAPAMEQLATTPLDDMLKSVTALTNLLSTSNSTSTYSSLPAIVSSLTTADDDLTDTLTALRKHQSNYAHILELRKKADELEEEIKNILRKADSLRTGIGQIDRSILDDTHDEAESTEVDYETLLTFAARIGKHNSAAAQEAEWEADRRALESRGGPNGQEEDTTEDDIARQKADMDLGIAHQRAAMGMAFPENSVLRLGALGRLQMLREGDRGEAAVDDEVARLVQETEAVSRVVAGSEEVVQASLAQEEKEKGNKEWREREVARRKAAAARNNGVGAGKPVKQETKKKTLSLDFDDDSDDEEED